MEVTLGTKILARLADFSIYILIITPVVSVILTIASRTALMRRVSLVSQ